MISCCVELYYFHMVQSLFSSYVRRVISAACPLSCRPGGGIELTRASAGGRPAHVCVVEVAMDVDVILTGSTGLDGPRRSTEGFSADYS